MLIRLIQSSKPKLFMLFCQINQPQQNLLSVIAQLPVKKAFNPHSPKTSPNNLKIIFIWAEWGCFHASWRGSWAAVFTQNKYMLTDLAESNRHSSFLKQLGWIRYQGFLCKWNISLKISIVTKTYLGLPGCLTRKKINPSFFRNSFIGV